MAGEKELRQRLQQLSGLVRQLEEIADPGAKAAAKDLVQLLMDLHGATLERVMEKIFETGDAGQRMIDELGADPLVGGFLVLYGLHPEEMESRIRGALQRIAPDLRSHSAAAELVSLAGGDLRIRAGVGAHACGSTAATVRKLIEDAVYEAAPDVTGLTIEGLDGKSASGFVLLETLLTHHPAGMASAASGIYAKTAAQHTDGD